MTIPRVHVENMDSPRTGRPVANQFIIRIEEGRYFQSYQSIIAFKQYGSGHVTLDVNKWDYSVTTGKYRNEFLGENIAETRRKIKSGEYTLEDLNK